MCDAQLSGELMLSACLRAHAHGAHAKLQRLDRLLNVLCSITGRHQEAGLGIASQRVLLSGGKGRERVGTTGAVNTGRGSGPGFIRCLPFAPER